MRLSPRKALLLPLLLGVAVLGYMAWGGRRSVSSPERTASLSMPSAARSPVPVIAEPARPALAASAPSAASSPPPAWTSALSSAHPYADAKQLRNARQPGSFLASVAIMHACRTAWAQANLGLILGPARDPLANAANDPNLAQRQQAKALISARCEPFTQDRSMEVPLADDAYGQAAYKAIKWRPSDGAAALVEAARVLAEQGQLHQLRSPLYRWNGQSMREESALYGSALGLARQLATAPADNVAEDVRLLELCVRLGRCGRDTSEVWFQGSDISPERRRQIEALAQEMAQALREGDYEKFLR